jgi:Fe-S cluster assembly protein SufD
LIAAPDSRASWVAELHARQPALPGAHVPWLHALRAQALAGFSEGGFPTLRHEDWKYTDVRAIVQRRFELAKSLAGTDADRFAPLIANSVRLVFVDGFFAPGFSQIGALPGGVQIASLAEMLGRGAAVLEPWLGRITPDPAQGFAALNSALLQDGAFLHVARGVAVERPIELLFLAGTQAESAGMPRNLFVLEAGAEATVIERHIVRSGCACLTSSVTEIAIDVGAGLEHYRIEDESDAAFHVGATFVRLGGRARYRSHDVNFGARIARHDIQARIEGENAECLLNGLYVTRGRQHVDNHARVDHYVPRGTSREWYRGVLDGSSRTVFSGRVVVHPGAQKTDAEQSNHNLLLSEGAEADSRPQLEIHADDVKCSHGSTVGSLDAEALFYLRSRGIDETQARDLLVRAFASDVLVRMRLAPLRQRLERTLAQRLALSTAGA